MKSRVFNYILNVFDLFFKKNNNNAFFIPHTNCRSDLLDIINYSSDNTLFFLNYLLKDDRFNDLNIYVFVYNYNKDVVRNYYLYLQHMNISNRVVFVNADFEYKLKYVLIIIKTYFYYLKCRFVFNSAPYTLKIPFVSRKQILISLNYYTPFKNDYFKTGKINNIKIDHCISTSKLASQIISISERIAFESFIELGYPRNDNFFKPRISHELLYEYLSNQFNCNLNNKNILIYTPTHREKEYDNCSGLFGYSELDDDLNDFLGGSNSIIIIKPHPA